MLREGLGAEFPAARRTLAALRRPRVSREEPLWAALSAFGAAWLVSTLGALGPEIARYAGWRDLATILTAAVAVVAAALGVAVAWRAGGSRGLLYFLLALALREGTSFVARLPGFLAFCERSGSQCSYTAFLGPVLEAVAGALLGIAAARLVASAPRGTNPTLAGAGAFSLASSIAGVALAGGGPQDAAGAIAITLATAALAGIVGGLAIRARDGGRRAVTIVAAVVAVPWLAVYVPLALVPPPILAPAYLLVGPVGIAALVAAARLPGPR